LALLTLAWAIAIDAAAFSWASLTFSLASFSTYFTASRAFFSALDTVVIAALVLATYF
jgi:hypothetical protein